MDVNVHATQSDTKPTGSRLIGFADFVGIARRFIVGRAMGCVPHPDCDDFSAGRVPSPAGSPKGVLRKGQGDKSGSVYNLFQVMLLMFFIRTLLA